MRSAPLLIVSLLCPLLAACNDDTACAAFFDGDAVVSEWSWTADEVVSLPLVADVDGDGAPDIAVNTTRSASGDAPTGEIVLLDGRSGAEKWRIAHDPGTRRFGSHGRSTIALADVDDDGRPDIVYAGREDDAGRSAIHAVDGAGELLWTSHTAGGAEARLTVQNGAAAVANLDGDPNLEIVFGAAIFDHDGRMVWNQDGEGGVFGTPRIPETGATIYTGGLATLADLDGDGALEIISGREAWTIAWTPGDPPSVSLSLFWRDTSGYGNDGWPAVADLDGDGDPEVVLVAWPEIKVLDGRTGELWCGVDPTGAACEGDATRRTQPIEIAGGNLGGPATIADFDGDGRPEVGIAGGSVYAVYDLAREGEEIAQRASDPEPDPGAMFVRWASTTQDQSSAATGATAFDFDGDGTPELLYQDECAVRVFDGRTGEVWLERANSSSTIHEYPVVADIDGDGATEFLVVANLGIESTNEACVAADPGFTPRQGVFAYGPGQQAWALAPPSWTQHTGHGAAEASSFREASADAPACR